MIHKIEGYDAWVISISDLKLFIETYGPAYCMFEYFDLPLFSTKLTPLIPLVQYILGVDRNHYILAIGIKLSQIGVDVEMSLNFVEEVNKIWNNTYDQNT